MAVTKKADFFIREILAEAITGSLAGMKALYGTNAVVMNGSLGSTLRGQKVQIPYFGNLGELEDLADNEGGAGALPALTPTGIQSAAEESIIHHSGKAFDISKWAEYSVSYADPYQMMADQFTDLVKRRLDKAAMDEASTTDLVYDNTPNTIKTVTWDAIVRGKSLFGDELEDMGGIALGVAHSKVTTDAELLKDSQGRPLLVNAPESGLPRIGGITFGKSDRLFNYAAGAGTISIPANSNVVTGAGTAFGAGDVGKIIRVNGKTFVIATFTSATSITVATNNDSFAITAAAFDQGTGTYNTLLARPNSIAVWYNAAHAADVQTFTNPLTDSTQAAVHLYWAVHRYRRMPGASRTGVAKIITQ